ncbi:aminotransferase [Pseudoroseicyclus sp. H15]
MTNNISELAALDRDHHMHPWTHFEQAERDGPLVMTKGKGVHLWDEDGRQYLDAVGGMWCTQIGLGNEEMADTLAEQARTLAYTSTFVDMGNAPSARLAAKIAEIAPTGFTRTLFTTGGSTAVDSAYRMAQFVQHHRGFPGRTHILSRHASYHGSTFASASIGMRNGDRIEEFSYLEKTIHHLSAPNPYRRPEGVSAEGFTDFLVKELEEKIAEVGADKIAAFFAEPVQASGGVIIPPEGYFKRMAEICHKHGILVVADEVVTAFGRLGEWFSSEAKFGVVPDMITSAKGLTSGYQPLGALIFSEGLWQEMSGDRWFTHGFTYSGHPIACAAALKSIEIIERDGLLDHAKHVGALFQKGLKSLEDHPLVGEARGDVLIGCIENVANKETKALHPDEIDIGKRVSNAAEKMGLLVRPMGHLNVMSPPLIISEGEVEEIITKLRASLDQVADQLVREGEKVA